MNIGSHLLDNNLILAPMAGITDRPYRQLCRKLGAGLTVSEMVAASPELYRSRKSVLRTNLVDDPSPRVVQIAGADPGLLADAAMYYVDKGAEIIDINMGCPAKKVCNAQAGSALLKDEFLVERILARVVNAVDVPVTLKIRTGWDTENKNALNIAMMAERSGVRALTIHGRTRACKFKGRAEHLTTKLVRENVSIPVIANGDIDSPEEAKRVLELTGADGLMIGRAARGNPWIFAEINHYLRTGRKFSRAGDDTVKNTLVSHISSLHEYYGEYQGVRIARKHIAWYCGNRAGSKAFLALANQATGCQEQIKIVQAYFDSSSVEDQAA